MSVQQHTASTSLLADPSVQAEAGGGNFPVVARGYHRGEVDKWVQWALHEIESLGHQVTSFAGSPEGQKMLADLIQIAADEIMGQKQAAMEEAEQMLAGARQQADGIISGARQQADQITSKATQQAASLVSNAQSDAKKTTDAAQAEAAAVHETAGARLEAFIKIHEDGLARMQQMHDVTGRYMAEENGRGSLRTEVEKALAPLSGRTRSLLAVDVRSRA